MMDVQEIQVIPLKKSPKKNGQLRKNAFHLPVILHDELQTMPERKPPPPEEPEIPFEKWNLPPQPQSYLRCRSCEWF